MPAAVDTGGLPVSLLVVTSPAPSNPSTVLLQASLDSTLSCLPELSPATTPLLIVMDGYTIAGRGRWPHAALPPRQHCSMLHGQSSPAALISQHADSSSTATPSCWAHMQPVGKYVPRQGRVSADALCWLPSHASLTLVPFCDNNAARTKRGFIGQDMVAPYEELASKLPGLCERLGFKDYRIVRLPTHHGGW